MKGRRKEEEKKKKRNWNPHQKRTFARLNSLLLLRQKEGEKMQFENVAVVWLSLYTSRQKMIKGANHISLTRPSKRKKTSPHRRIYEKRPKLNQSWGKWKFSKERKKEKNEPNGMRIDRSHQEKVYTQPRSIGLRYVEKELHWME